MPKVWDAENATITQDGDRVIIEMNIGNVGHRGAKSDVMASLGSGQVVQNSKGQSVRVMGNAFTVTPKSPKNAPTPRTV